MTQTIVEQKAGRQVLNPPGPNPNAEYSNPFAVLNRIRDARERRIDDLNLPQLKKMVETWLKSSPLIIASDARKAVVAQLLLSETHEYVAELETEFNSFEDWLLCFMEGGDQAVIALSFAIAHWLSLNFDRIKDGIDGQGSASRIFENLGQVAGDIDQYPEAATIEEFLILWSSAITRLPKYLSMPEVMTAILTKNRNNYPPEYFQVFFKGKWLTPEEQIPAYEHRVRCLRLIRDYLKIIRQPRPLGLMPEDHRRFAHLITNHLQPESSFLAILDSLAQQMVREGQASSIFSATNLLLRKEQSVQTTAGGVLIYDSNVSQP